jgi:hypothetical protein
MIKSVFKKSSLLAGLALAMFACKPEIDNPISKGGEIDITRYVAVGNSLTAGFADGGLYNEAIENSYPNFLAGQLRLVGGGDFDQPFFPEANRNGSGFQIVTGFDAAGSPILATQTENLAVTGPGRFVRFAGSNNQNLGIPGIAAVHVTSQPYSLANGFFERLLPEGSTGKTYLQLIEEANPTFFTCWMGNNDVLGYVTSGGTTFTPGQGGITPAPLFDTSYGALLNQLTANGAKGVVANIPNISFLPFVRTANGIIAQRNNPTTPTFPRVSFPLANGVTAAQANQFYQLNNYTSPNFTDGDNNFFVIEVDDPATSVKEVRQMNPAQDFLLLTFLGKAGQLATGLGVLRPNPDFNPANPIGPGNLPALPNPIIDADVLDAAEVLEVQTATTAFNGIIATKAAAKGLPVVDANAIFQQIVNDGRIDGVAVTTAFVSGGLFSLDGIHLTPRGAAIVANQFIKAINSGYDAKIPLVNVGGLNLRGVKLP